MKTYDYKIFVVLIILSFIFFIIHTHTKKISECIKKQNDKKKIIVTLLIHQMLEIFYSFGWLFNDKIILILYVIYPFIIFFHWYTNDCKCILTQIESRICDSDDTRFVGLYEMIGLTKFSIWNNYLYYFFLFICYFIAFYKLLIIYKVIKQK